jgi:hypothetical protein
MVFTAPREDERNFGNYFDQNQNFPNLLGQPKVNKIAKRAAHSFR